MPEQQRPGRKPTSSSACRSAAYSASLAGSVRRSWEKTGKQLPTTLVATASSAEARTEGGGGCGRNPRLSAPVARCGRTSRTHMTLLSAEAGPCRASASLNARATLSSQSAVSCARAARQPARLSAAAATHRAGVQQGEELQEQHGLGGHGRGRGGHERPDQHVGHGLHHGQTLFAMPELRQRGQQHGVRLVAHLPSDRIRLFHASRPVSLQRRAKRTCSSRCMDCGAAASWTSQPARSSLNIPKRAAPRDVSACLRALVWRTSCVAGNDASKEGGDEDEGHEDDADAEEEEDSGDTSSNALNTAEDGQPSSSANSSVERASRTSCGDAEAGTCRARRATDSLELPTACREGVNHPPPGPQPTYSFHVHPGFQQGPQPADEAGRVVRGEPLQPHGGPHVLPPVARERQGRGGRGGALGPQRAGQALKRAREVRLDLHCAHVQTPQAGLDKHQHQHGQQRPHQRRVPQTRVALAGQRLAQPAARLRDGRPRASASRRVARARGGGGGHAATAP
jgi:hypothetical protein